MRDLQSTDKDMSVGTPDLDTHDLWLNEIFCAFEE